LRLACWRPAHLHEGHAARGPLQARVNHTQQPAVEKTMAAGRGGGGCGLGRQQQLMALAELLPYSQTVCVYTAHMPFNTPCRDRMFCSTKGDSEHESSRGGRAAGLLAGASGQRAPQGLCGLGHIPMQISNSHHIACSVHGRKRAGQGVGTAHPRAPPPVDTVFRCPSRRTAAAGPALPTMYRSSNDSLEQHGPVSIHASTLQQHQVPEHTWLGRCSDSSSDGRRCTTVIRRRAQSRRCPCRKNCYESSGGYDRFQA
jgi:hypothetical protein